MSVAGRHDNVKRRYVVCPVERLLANLRRLYNVADRLARSERRVCLTQLLDDLLRTVPVSL